MVAARGSPDSADEELLAAWAGGDERAFDALYDRYAGRVTGYAWRMLGHREDAEEVCVETFTRIVEHRWRNEGVFRAWLFTVAHRCCLERLRRRTLTDRVMALFGATHRPTPESPESEILRDERGRNLQRAIDELPVEHRATLLLSCAQELPAREVGTVLGLTEQQVRSQLSYARRLLREQLTPRESRMTDDLPQLSELRDAPAPPIVRVRRRVAYRRTRRRIFAVGGVAAAVGLAMLLTPGIREWGLGGAPLVALDAVAEGPHGVRPLGDGAVVGVDERVVFFVRTSVGGAATLRGRRQRRGRGVPRNGRVGDRGRGERPGGTTPLSWRPDRPVTIARYELSVCAEPDRCGIDALVLRWTP